MEDATTLATFSYGGQRKGRGLRRTRGGSSACWGRVFQTLLVCVCAFFVAGAVLLAGEFSKMAGMNHQDRGEILSSESATDAGTTALNMAMGDEVPRNRRRLVSRIGFGSCTSRVAIAQPIWSNGVIPSDLDAWIWCALGIQPQ